MNAMQGKILGRIRERIEAAGAEFVQVEQWANTGTVYAQHDLDTGWQVAYEFDSRSASLHFTGPAVAELGLTDNPPDYRVDRGSVRGEVSFHALSYDEAERLRVMLGLVERFSAAFARTYAIDLDHIVDLGPPDGGRYWRILTGEPADHPDAEAAAVQARVSGSVGCTYNGVKVERIDPANLAANYRVPEPTNRSER